MTTHCVFLPTNAISGHVDCTSTFNLQLLTSANQPEILCICMYILFVLF